MAASGERVAEGTIDRADGRALGYAESGAPDGPPLVYLNGLHGWRLDPTHARQGECLR